MRHSAGLAAELVGIHEHQFGVAAHDGQEVVEIMRHAAGELADGFHLLRLAELGLQPAAFGDVAEGPDSPVVGSVVAQHRRGGIGAGWCRREFDLIPAQFARMSIRRTTFSRNCCGSLVVLRDELNLFESSGVFGDLGGDF